MKSIRTKIIFFIIAISFFMGATITTLTTYFYDQACTEIYTETALDNAEFLYRSLYSDNFNIFFTKMIYRYEQIKNDEEYKNIDSKTEEEQIEYLVKAYDLTNDNLTLYKNLKLSLESIVGSIENTSYVSVFYYDSEYKRVVSFLDSTETHYLGNFYSPGEYDPDFSEIKIGVYKNKIKGKDYITALRRNEPIDPTSNIIVPDVIFCVDLDSQAITNEVLRFAGRTIFMSLAVTLFVIIIGVILTNRFLMIPITKMKDSSQKTIDLLNVENTGEIPFEKIHINTKDELSLLASTYNRMGDEINKHIKNLEDKTREQARLNSELSISSKLQIESLNAKEYLGNTYEINAYIKPASQVGGDFYDYFTVNNILYFVIADVSGKGIPASLFMMRSMAIIKNKLLFSKNFAKSVCEINNELLENNKEGYMLTAFIGKLDLKSLKLDYINCGHLHPIIIGNNSRVLDCKSNFILAGVNDFEYEVQSINLSSDDQIVLYTDGITEATNAKLELYGNRIEDIVNHKFGFSPKEINKYIIDDLFNFVDGYSQADDITLLTISLNDEPLIINNSDIKDVENVSKYIVNKLPKETDEKIVSEIRIIIDEQASNMIIHSISDNKGYLMVKAFIKDDLLIMEFVDNGVYFNPLEEKGNEVKEDVLSIEEGGFGIKIIKSISNSYEYDRISNLNRITITKKIK